MEIASWGASPLDSEFDAILLESIDEAISALGNPVTQTIYSLLEQSFDIRKNEIPKRLDGFKQALENILGAGCDPIEILMLKKLYEKVGRVFTYTNPGEIAFLRCIATAKFVFQERSMTALVNELARDKKLVKLEGGQ